MPKGVYDRKPKKAAGKADVSPAAVAVMRSANDAWARRHAMELSISVDRTGNVDKVVAGAKKIMGFLAGE